MAKKSKINNNIKKINTVKHRNRCNICGRPRGYISFFGICRICGNLPNLSPYTRDCNPVMSDTVLMAGRIDPFQVLPAESTPRVHALMHHCTSWNSQEAPPSTNIENREYNSSSFPNPDPLPILHQSSLAISSHRQPHPVQHHIVCGGYPRCWTSRL